MGKKTTIDTDNLLNRQGFGSEEQVLTSVPKSHGVSAAKQISITTDEIHYFKFNPRTVENPKYDEIKESIREIGLENPLTVTKRPGEAGYTLYNGGNTRLKILKELYKETGEEQFYYIDCRFMPFTTDSEIMIKHMIENETRGGMLLIDKAKAAYKIKLLYEEETGEKLSLRRLADVMGEKGWKISFVNVGLFIFTAELLVEKIPLALTAGLGKPKVVNIRKNYNAIKDYLVAKLPELNIEEIQNVYLDNLAKYDSEDGIDDYPLIDTCKYISDKANIEAPRIRMEIDYIMQHGKVYDEPSLSPKFDDKGRRINSPDAPQNVGGGQTTTASASGEKPTSDSGGKSEIGGQDSGGEGNNQQSGNDNKTPGVLAAVQPTVVRTKTHLNRIQSKALPIKP